VEYIHFTKQLLCKNGDTPPLTVAPSACGACAPVIQLGDFQGLRLRRFHGRAQAAERGDRIGQALFERLPSHG
jgi:hypothetical protein